MGKKKGLAAKTRGRAVANSVETTQQEALRSESLSNELEALQCIYEHSFHMLNDGMGCSVRVVPHPGQAEEKDVHLDLEFRCGTSSPHPRAGAAVLTMSPRL